MLGVLGRMSRPQNESFGSGLSLLLPLSHFSDSAHLHSLLKAGMVSNGAFCTISPIAMTDAGAVDCLCRFLCDLPVAGRCHGSTSLSCPGGQVNSHSWPPVTCVQPIPRHLCRQINTEHPAPLCFGSWADSWGFTRQPHNSSFTLQTS